MELDISQNYSELKVIKDTVEKHLLQCKSAYRAAYLNTHSLVNLQSMSAFAFREELYVNKARVWQQEFTE